MVHPATPMAIRLRIEGTRLGDPFATFVRGRLRWLGLDGVVEAGARRATVTVRGAPALIDMLEVACLLGPVDCRVEAVQRSLLGGRSEAKGAPHSSAGAVHGRD